MSNVSTEGTPQFVAPAWNTPSPFIRHKLGAGYHDLGGAATAIIDGDTFVPEFVFIESFDEQEHIPEGEYLTQILSGKKLSKTERTALICALRKHNKPFLGLSVKVPPSSMLDFSLEDAEVATEVLVRLSTTPCFNRYLMELASPKKIGIGLFTTVANLFCRVELPSDFLPGFVEGVLDVFELGREATDFKMNLFMVFVARFLLRQKVEIGEPLTERIKCFCISHSDLEWSNSVVEILSSHGKINKKA